VTHAYPQPLDGGDLHLVQANRVRPVRRAVHLPQIRELVSGTLLETRDELHFAREHLQEFIIRGTEAGYVIGVESRADTIAGYHNSIRNAKDRIARCERFLELVAQG
jgi:hypothetical protein